MAAQGSSGRGGGDDGEALSAALRLAFAHERELPAGVIGAGVAAAAERMGLGERIADRFPERVPERLKDRLRREASRGMLLEATLERVTEAAEAAGSDLVLLKGMALIRAGITSPGRRPCADVDVLASVEAAGAITARLLEGGFAPYEAPEGSYHHHEAPLIHPGLGAVEIHTRLPGVRIAGAEATAEAIRAADPAAPTDPARRAEGVRIPPPAILAAHAIAHSLYQERYLAHGIAFFRMTGDLLDLEGSGALDEPIRAARPFLEGSVPREELDALAALTRALAAGEAPRGPETRRMLDHFVSACLRPEEVRRELKWKRRLHVLRMPGGISKLVARLAGR